jgi:hypothetical protein
MRPRCNWRSATLALVLIAIGLEGAAAVICALLPTLPHTSRYLWSPHLEHVRANWNAGSSMLDRDLGGFIPPGPKPNPEFPADAQPCGSAYGDSFVFGFEVADDEGWIERLSHMLGCRIVNYAVGNYGIDQAYRLFAARHDKSRIAVLGVDVNGIMDVISQYDGLLGSEPVPVALKGRFTIAPSGNLKWVSLPHLDADAFVALNGDPSRFLPQSYFLPDSADGPVISRFPYTITLARLAAMSSVRAIVNGRADWSLLYGWDHPSEALPLMVAICEAFAELAHAQGQQAVIVLLPVSGSFRELARFGQFEYAPLVGALRAKNIDVLDAGPAMIAALGGRSACDYFNEQHRGELSAWIREPLPCGGHYSSFANAVVARFVYGELRRQGLAVH